RSEDATTAGLPPPGVAAPPLAWLTRVVVPACRSYRKTLSVAVAPVWPGTRSPARLAKATKRPSRLSASPSTPWLAAAVAEALAWLTRVVVPATRSYRYTFRLGTAFVSPGTRSVAELAKATNRPSALSSGLSEGASPLAVADALA